MPTGQATITERCAICGCLLHRGGKYAEPTINGRSHATRHHFVAERFFGRSGNRPGTQRPAIFQHCPWDSEGRTVVFCYECHEELIHNIVFLPDDITMLAKLVRLRRLSEEHKIKSRKKLGKRIELLHEVIAAGLSSLLAKEKSGATEEMR